MSGDELLDKLIENQKAMARAIETILIVNPHRGSQNMVEVMRKVASDMEELKEFRNPKTHGDGLKRPGVSILVNKYRRSIMIMLHPFNDDFECTLGEPEFTEFICALRRLADEGSSRGLQINVIFPDFESLTWTASCLPQKDEKITQ